jgi:hypothetical protein
LAKEKFRQANDAQPWIAKRTRRRLTVNDPFECTTRAIGTVVNGRLFTDGPH